MSNITFVMLYKTKDELVDSAAVYQLEGYSTVQVGPTTQVRVEDAANGHDWPGASGQSWFVLLASKDPMTEKETHEG
jgi:hypothetical protein